MARIVLCLVLLATPAWGYNQGGSYPDTPYKPITPVGIQYQANEVTTPVDRYKAPTGDPSVLIAEASPLEVKERPIIESTQVTPVCRCECGSPVIVTGTLEEEK